MNDNIEDLELLLDGIEHFSLNGCQFVRTIANGSFWNVSLVNKNGIDIIIKQLNQSNIHNYSEIEIKDIIHDEIHNFQILNNTKIFCDFLGISFTDLHNNHINYPIIVQKYSKNKSLKDFLNQTERNPRLNDDTKKMILIYGLAKKMKILVENRLCHCNLKPSKILLDENYYPFLSEVGSQMIRTDDNIFDEAYLYAAPETLLNNRYNVINEKSNVFTFGMITYHILTGNNPYNNIQNVDLHQIQLNAKRKIDFEIPENIPFFLRFLLSLTLSYNQNERPNFADIVDYFDRGIIFPSILKKTKEKKKFNQYLSTFPNNQLHEDSIDMLQMQIDNLDNERLKTVIHFFLADYYNVMQSQNIIGKYYYYGNILPKSGKKALEYFQKAKKQNDAESIFYIGQIYQNGFDCIADKNYAWKCFNKSASLGYEKAIEFVQNIQQFLQTDLENAPVVLLTGKFATGKTTFIDALINPYNKKDEMTTIGVLDYKVVHIENNQNYCLRIRDSMDLERFASFLPLCCRDVAVCIIMYSVTDRNSFKLIDKYYNELKEKCDNPRFIIIGNKIDLANATVSIEEGEQKAKQYGAAFIEVSSKRGTNVSLALSLIARISREVGPNANNIQGIDVVETYENPSGSCC